MGLKLVRTDIDEKYRADVSSINSKINKKTLAVIATAGTSSLGAVDPIEEINELCDGVFLHIDAAYGGFILPFIKKGELDFQKQNIDSISVDPHKLGGVPIPSGTLLFRDDSYQKNLTKSPTYIPVQTSTLSGSRSGGAIAATWATLMHYGFEGYEARARECMKNTEFLCNEIKRIPGASIITEPDLNIVGLKIINPIKTSDRLVEMGWKIALNKELGCIRFAVMPHINKEGIEEFLKDLRVAISYSSRR
jgi:tyrosine decarboxylase/aspartate 1-decarboxylase